MSCGDNLMQALRTQAVMCLTCRQESLLERVSIVHSLTSWCNTIFDVHQLPA